MKLKRIEHNGATWVVNKDFTNCFPIVLPDNLESESENVNILQRKSGRMVVIIPQGWDDSRDVVVKIYKARNWKDFPKYFFKQSKAEAEWKMYQRLRKIRVPTPVPLAMGIKRRFRFLLESYLVIETITPGQTFFKYTRKHMSSTAIRRYFECLARYIGKLHDKGFYFSDLQADNIMIPTNGDHEPRLYFIDLHRMRYVWRMPRWLSVRDIARLHSTVITSHRNRCRFIKTYLKKRGLYKPGTWRHWIIHIDNRTRLLWEESRVRKSNVNKRKYDPWQIRLLAERGGKGKET